MFYREVCVFVMQEKTKTPMTFKEMHRSLCGKCGKSFTNKRGLKQHIMRMHASTNKKIKSSKNMVDTTITLEEHVQVDKAMLESSPANEMPRSIRMDKDDGFDFIRNLLGEIIIESCKEIEVNYQCGECGKMYETLSESELPMNILKLIK